MTNEPIKEETLRTIKEHHEVLRDVLTRMSGSSDYGAAVQTLQTAATEFPSLVAFSRDAAQRLMPEATHGNTVDPTLFVHYLTALDKEEKVDLVLASMTEDQGQQISIHLAEMVKSVLPKMRELGLKAFQQLPHRRGGGREKEVDDNRAEKICGKIAKYIEHGVSIGDAQRRVGVDEALSERTVREVWQSRKKKYETAAGES